MHYFLSTWTGTGRPGDEYRPAGVDGTWSVIDLRPDASLTDGRCLVAAADRPPARAGVQYLAEGPDETMSSTTLGRLGNALSVSLVTQRFRRIVLELLLAAEHGGHARRDGTRWRPLRPLRQARNTWEIYLGELLWSLPRIAGGATFTESFDKADSDILGPDLTWTEVEGDLDVVSGRATLTALNVGNAARAEHDTTSSNNYAQFSLTSFDRGTGASANARPLCRMSPTAQTGYLFRRRHVSSGTDYALMKVVNGTATALVTDTAQALALPEVIRAEADGSTIRGLIDGVLKQSVTDTSITTGTRGGFTLFKVNSSGVVTIDDFSFGDLTAAAASLSAVRRPNMGALIQL